MNIKQLNLVSLKSNLFFPFFIEVLEPTSETKILDFEKHIPNDHLPFSFSIVSKEDYAQYNFKYFSPCTGIIIKLKRENLGNLEGSFYCPTVIFATLSMISFFIPHDVVCLTL